jgi:hypothetical protein
MPTNRNATDPQKPRRRWFQFGLRTLLIGVVLLAIPCGYVGWRAKIVRERKAWLNSHKPEMDFFSMMGARAALCTPKGWLQEEDQQPCQAPSRIRLWLGDIAYGTIRVRQSASTAEQVEAESLFPEAVVIIVCPPP